MKRALLFTQTLKALVALAVAFQMANWTVTAADYGKGKDKADAGSSTLTKKEISFINDAAQGGLMEVRMGELGQQKGQNPDLKQFAQRLVTDHSKANDELKQLASNKGVTLPTQLADKHQKMIDKLSNASDFDKQFKDMAVKDHKKDIKEFERAEKKCEDADLRAWITKTLPTLQEHLRMAEQLGVTRTANK
jgi:putative membrane protein